MAYRILSILFALMLTAQTCLIQAMPVDVDGDGKVGPLELIDLSLNWKGPALLPGVQPWQFNGSDIFYEAGKVGIGSATPHHQLRISGGPVWTSHGWTGSVELDHSSAIAWQNSGPWMRYGIGYTNGELCFFRTLSDPGTSTDEPIYDLIINDYGNLLIGDALSNGSKVEIAAQDGLAITGFQPFLTLRDTNAGNARGVIQSANGNLFFYPDSFIGGSPPVTIKNVSGNVGIGTTNHSAGVKLEVRSNFEAGFTGIYGESNGTSGIGISGSGGDIGVSGSSSNGIGARGFSVEGVGVKGEGTDGRGVWGESYSNQGVYGHSYSQVGVVGESDLFDGVWGISNHVDHAGVSGHNKWYNGLAGFFDGNVIITGGISKAAGSFRIDHPLDPANKYLSHSFVESPDMKNVYDGNAVTDASGHAEVVLPDYFEALNKDFRYQLTVIGQFAQAIVEKRIENNRFTIRTDKPNVEVSWQVTGIRQDAWAIAHPIEVEKAKAEDERGKYLTPIEYGQPKEKGVYYRPETRVSSRPDSGVK